MKDKFLKIIGGIIGGIISLPIVAFFLLYAYGSIRSCTVTPDHERVEKELAEQPLILHYLPRAARYAIYDISRWFSKKEEKPKTLSNKHEWKYCCKVNDIVFLIYDEIEEREDGNKVAVVLSIPQTEEMKRNLFGGVLEGEAFEEAAGMLNTMEFDFKGNKYKVLTASIVGKKEEMLWHKLYDEGWEDVGEYDMFGFVLETTKDIVNGCYKPNERAEEIERDIEEYESKIEEYKKEYPELFKED